MPVLDKYSALLLATIKSYFIKTLKINYLNTDYE
jgi:hypothetical protein